MAWTDQSVNVFAGDITITPDNVPVGYEAHLKELQRERQQIVKVYGLAMKMADEAQEVEVEQRPAYMAVALKAAQGLESRLYGKPVEKVQSVSVKGSFEELQRVMRLAKVQAEAL